MRIRAWFTKHWYFICPLSMMGMAGYCFAVAVTMPSEGWRIFNLLCGLVNYTCAMFVWYCGKLMRMRLKLSFWDSTRELLHKRMYLDREVIASKEHPELAQQRLLGICLTHLKITDMIVRHDSPEDIIEALDKLISHD